MQWYQSGRNTLHPEDAVAILRDPDMLAIHDPGFTNLVKLV